MSKKAIVLDANILIRAVLGRRVRELIVDSADVVQFFAPDVAYADARKYLPSLLKKRGVKSDPRISPSLTYRLKNRNTAFGRVPTYPRLAIDDAAKIDRQSGINLYGCFGVAPLSLAMTAIERRPLRV